MLSLMEPLAAREDRLCELQGSKLERVESGIILKTGDFIASIS